MNIATFKEIPIKIHSSLLVLVGALAGYQLITQGLPAAITIFWFGFLLFSSVLLHELGHAMCAKIYGIDTRDITLYPFGGIAAISGEKFDDPEVELWISLAGPAVNFMIAGLTSICLVLNAPFLSWLFIINLIMGVFNLVPAYPMDGGRILRSLLSLKLERKLATKISIIVAFGFASVFLYCGVVYRWIGLFIIGLLLFYYNGPEYKRLYK